MDKITRKLHIQASREKAYKKFLDELNEWWPKEYTWSQHKLKEIRVDGREGGLCTEIGPYGFRCDWGRITTLTENESIEMKWQISPNREPVPNPENASELKIGFVQNGDFTMMELEHFNFGKHGQGADDYRKMMDSTYGWDHILNNFKEYCEK